MPCAVLLIPRFASERAAGVRTTGQGTHRATDQPGSSRVMQPLTAGITKANTGIDGIVWNILGQTYVPKQLSENSFAWHAIFPPGTFVPPHIHPTQDEFTHEVMFLPPPA